MPGAPDTRLADRVELANRFRRLLQFDSVLLAVSGGSDSVALLRLVDLWSAELDGSGPAISVATVDHGLREGSAEEADFVAQLASSLGYDHVTLRWQGTKPEAALQAQAREARYRLLIERALVMPSLVWCPAISKSHGHNRESLRVALRNLPHRRN
ncbi:MAG: ATP-binding protein, partial [Pseudomonadota bacterium]